MENFHYENHTPKRNNCYSFCGKWRKESRQALQMFKIQVLFVYFVLKCENLLQSDENAKNHRNKLWTSHSTFWTSHSTTKKPTKWKRRKSEILRCELCNNIVVRMNQIQRNPFRIQATISKHEIEHESQIVTKEKPRRKCQANLIACFKWIQAQSQQSAPSTLSSYHDQNDKLKSIS